MIRYFLIFLSFQNIFFISCFTTLQTAKVKKKFHLSIETGRLSDQKRNQESQGSDIITFVTPSYGFGKSKGMEFGIPIGWYFEEGLNSLKSDSRQKYGQSVNHFLILPYIKIGLYQDKKDKIALVGQTAFLYPMSISIIYSHDFIRWSPFFSVKKIFSGDPAGDDPMVTRYQEHNQSIWVAAIGVELATKFNPALEIGLFRNSYEEGFVYGYFGGEGKKRVLYDFFVGGKVTF